MNADQIRSALACGRQGCECARGGVKTHCPGPSHVHGDQHPSLGVEDRDGKTLVKCYGGCDQDAVISVLQSRDLWPRATEREPHRQNGATRIVATYDYRDASGGLSFQVVRLEPKDFRQRRPSKAGGWEWKTGDRSIIYRLPELLAARDEDIVFACEGEKDVDRLGSLGLVATTAAGGAGKWSDGNSQWLDGRRVAILPDNDVAGEKDTATKLRSIRPVADRVAVVMLDHLPAAGDVSDWLANGGSRERLLELAEAALTTAEPRPEVRPIPTPALSAFPVRVLPRSMRTLIESGARAMLVPAEFIAVPMLVLAGSVIGNAWEIELKGGWREGPNLYAAIVGDPGAKKTPSLKLALRGIHQIQERLHAEYRTSKANYDEEMALWEKTPKKDRADPPEQPRFQHVWTSDSTTEALAEMLSGAKGIVLFRDELVGWVKSMDQYRSGKGADRQHYLSMWSRSQIKIDRKSAPAPIIVDRPCLSVVGGIQPDILPDLVENAQRDDGFIDRLLFAYPDIGEDHWTDAGVDQAAQVAVERLFEGLYDLTGAEMPSGDVVPRVALLGAEARALWAAWYEENSTEHRSEDLPSSLKGTWAKMPSQLARLALILHIGHAVDAGLRPSAMVSDETLAGAVVLVDYFKEHTRAVLGELRSPRPQLEERILRGLVEHGSLVTRRIHLEILNGSVKYDRVKATLEKMLEDGLVTVATATTGKGGRPGRLWTAVEQDEPSKMVGRTRSSSFHRRGAG